MRIRSANKVLLKYATGHAVRWSTLRRAAHRRNTTIPQVCLCIELGKLVGMYTNYQNAARKAAGGDDDVS